MSHKLKITPQLSRREFLAVGAGLLVSAAGSPTARATERVRIGLATRTWFPSVIAKTAVDLGLFKKEGIGAELTIYQSGAEALTAMAAGAADVIASSPAVVVVGRQRGVACRIVGSYTTGNFGWHLMVLLDSNISDASQLGGKKVGITTAGSLSDALALWTMQDKGVKFTTVPVGGGGLVPNLIARNLAAAVVYSPLSFQVMQNKEGRSILDYGKAMPAHLNSGWAALDKFIANNRELLQKTLNALYGGLVFLQKNREEAIQIIAKVNDISKNVASQEFEEVFLKLSPDGYMDLKLAEKALELARIAGITALTDAKDIFTREIAPIPTQA